MIIQSQECFKCGEELERDGVSEFGECPECGRKMRFREWQALRGVYLNG